MMHILPPTISTFGQSVDSLFVLIAVFTGIGFLAAEAAFFYAIVRFRQGRQPSARPILGERWREARWVLLPVGLLVVADGVIDARTHSVWQQVKEELPAADRTIRITGQQFTWTFTYPGPDGKLGTPDDFTVPMELHVPVNETVVFDLEARDVLHSFFVPALRLKQDAVPGRTIRGWFKALAPGTYDIACAQICGVAHGVMGAKLMVQTKEEYEQWAATRAAAASQAATSRAGAQPAEVVEGSRAIVPSQKGIGTGHDLAAPIAYLKQSP